MFRRFRSRLTTLWTWRRQEADLDDEIRFHLSEEADERVAGGLTTEAARFAAKKDFGVLVRHHCTDGSTFLGVLLLFAAVAFVSTYIPARRAATVDPAVALRSE